VLVTLWQSMNNVMHRWSVKKQLTVTRRIRIIIKHVHLVTYLTVIKHLHERASFCNISKAGLATGRKVMSPADVVIYF